MLCNVFTGLTANNRRVIDHFSFPAPLSGIFCHTSVHPTSELCPGGSYLGPALFCMSLFSAMIHKLKRSMLSLSPLRTLLTMPSLKYFSSPAAVFPPMYILSAPSTSRKPSVELSLPRRRGC